MRISDWSSDVCSSDLPQLSGDPLQGFQRIVLFLDHAKVGLHAAGVARAAHVEPHRGVAVAGKVAMDLGVARRVLVVLPVRQDLKDRGDRLLMRSFRQPELGGQPNTVRKRNPAVRSEARRLGKEWVSTCRSRGSPSHLQQKQTYIHNTKRLYS